VRHSQKLTGLELTQQETGFHLRAPAHREHRFQRIVNTDSSAS
jgi:hypothetical protein